MNRWSWAAFAAALLAAIPAFAQDLQPRQLDATGAIEIIIRDATADDDDDPVHRERATGVIITPEGHVLTAAHIFSEEHFAVCNAAANSANGQTCTISFYPKANEARRVAARIVSGRNTTHDFILLRLPQASDVLDRPEWPYVFVGQEPRAGAQLMAGGYAGDLTFRVGGANPINVVPGVMSAAQSAPCTEGDGWGVSSLMSGQTAPGYSGGPVFDGRGRLVAIVLGGSCSGGLQGASATRILPLASMPNLCTTIRCRYGLPGYIAPYNGANARDWRERVEGGAAAANNFFYGWRLTALSQITFSNGAFLCSALTNPQVAQQIRADYDLGGELATVFQLMSANCSNTMAGPESDTIHARVFALADAGYEPAQHAAGQIIMGPLWSKIMMAGASFDYNFTDQESADIARAMDYFNRSADMGWAGSIYARFTLCRMRVAQCTANAGDLERAAALGAWEARLELALYLLQGEDSPSWTRQTNFSMPQNTQRAIALLRENAQPVSVSQSFPAAIFDAPSAGWLAYLYGDGRINGRQLVTPDLNQAMMFEQGCYGGAQANPQFPPHMQCGFFGAIARFNLGGAAEKQMARDTLRFISQASSPHGYAARTLLSWVEGDYTITRISCDLDANLQFAPPAQQPTFERGVAYCHFPPN